MGESTGDGSDSSFSGDEKVDRAKANKPFLPLAYHKRRSTNCDDQYWTPVMQAALERGKLRSRPFLPSFLLTDNLHTRSQSFH
jgi:hypothetical protein